MNFCFRTDSSTKIGTGHLMRCLTLADQLKDAGGDITFVCRELPGNLSDLVVDRGYSLFLLPDVSSGIRTSLTSEKYADWLGVDWQTDADQTRSVLPAIGKIDWLIIDHYALDANWEMRFRPIVNKIMIIDDLADRPHECDVLLDQNLQIDAESRYKGLVPDRSRLFLGLRHALLRKEFHNAKTNLRRRSGAIDNILVFFGGADISDETTKALKAIKTINRSNIKINAILGGANVRADSIISKFADVPKLVFHRQVKNMAELMAEADLAIGGGGTTTWERCYLGLPTITVVMAENQRTMIEAAAERGALWNLGMHSGVSREAIHEKLTWALNNPTAVKETGRAAAALMDNTNLTAKNSVVAALLEKASVPIERA